MQIIEQSQQLKKHIGTVHIAAPLSLLQRKAFSVLLFNAYPKLASARTHTIPVDALSELLGYDSKDLATLKSALRFLVTTPIEWIGADSERWAMTTFLSFVEIKGGVCTYRYDEFLAEKLYQPEVYARINLGVLRHFQSKYAVALYENCARYRPNGAFPGGTPDWSLEEFRLIMGVKDVPLFDEFKRINAKIIQPAIKEINTYSDIVLTPVLRKEGRSFVGIRFDVKDNPQMSFNFVSEGPPVKDMGEMPEVARMRDRYGVPEGVAIAWFNAFGSLRFQEVLDLADAEAEKGTLRNPVGFITWAFEKGAVKGRDPKDIQREVREEKSRRQQEQRKKQIRPQLVEEAKKKLESLYDKHLREIVTERLNAMSPTEQAGVVQAWLNDEGSFLKHKYGQATTLKEIGAGALFLVGVLIRQWKVADELPFPVWQKSEGYDVKESGDTVVIIKNGNLIKD